MTPIFKLKKFQIKNQLYNRIGYRFYYLFKQKPKVFGIGLNRTGSSSLGRYFQMLGYMHSFETYSVHKIERMINDKKYLKKIMDRFEMHEDWPNAMVYKELAEMYPNAKFILTIRESADKWFNSLLNTSIEEQKYSNTGNNVKKLIYGYSIINEEQRAELVSFYNKHNSEVQDYFKGTGRLLILSTGDSEKEKLICDFLGIPISSFNYPHSQKRNY